MIVSGYFSPEAGASSSPCIRSLLDYGDRYFLMADYRQYVNAQEEVGRIYTKQDEWVRRSILNTAYMGKFSSDRAIMEYAGRIWNISPLKKKK